MHQKGMNHCEPLLAKGLVLSQFQHPLTMLCQRFCDQNPDLEDCLTLVLELNYSLGNLIGAPAGIRTPNLLIRSQMLYPLSYGRSFCVNDLTIAFTSLESKVRSLPIEKAVGA